MSRKKIKMIYSDKIDSLIKEHYLLLAKMYEIGIEFKNAHPAGTTPEQYMTSMIDYSPKLAEISIKINDLSGELEYEAAKYCANIPHSTATLQLECANLRMATNAAVGWVKIVTQPSASSVINSLMEKLMPPDAKPDRNLS